MDHQHRKILSRYRKHYEAIFCGLEDMSDDELRTLQIACDTASSTNCAWSEYRVALILKPEIAGVQRRRALAAAQQPIPEAVEQH